MTEVEEKLARMREGGRRLAEVFAQVLPQVKPGLTLSYIDRLVEGEIKRVGGRPSFKMVAGYDWASCINLNQGVVHGIPGERKIKVGDLVSLDVGLFYRGYHTDRAETVLVKRGDRVRADFIETGKKVLVQAIAQAKPGNQVGHISRVIQDGLVRVGYSPIRALTGHGIGKKLHQGPVIPCYLEGELESTPSLKAGMTLAIEVIYAAGKPDLAQLPDGWTIQTADGKIAGLFEETVAVAQNGPFILTQKD